MRLTLCPPTPTHTFAAFQFGSLPNLAAPSVSGNLAGKQEQHTLNKMHNRAGSSLSQFTASAAEQTSYQNRASVMDDGLDELDLNLSTFSIVCEMPSSSASAVDHLVAHPVLTPRKPTRPPSYAAAAGREGRQRRRRQGSHLPSAEELPPLPRRTTVSGARGRGSASTSAAPALPARPSWMVRLVIRDNSLPATSFFC